jgi:hypothetical protein
MLKGEMTLRLPFVRDVHAALRLFMTDDCDPHAVAKLLVRIALVVRAARAELRPLEHGFFHLILLLSTLSRHDASPFHGGDPVLLTFVCIDIPEPPRLPLQRRPRGISSASNFFNTAGSAVHAIATNSTPGRSGPGQRQNIADDDRPARLERRRQHANGVRRAPVKLPLEFPDHGSRDRLRFHRAHRSQAIMPRSHARLPAQIPKATGLIGSAALAMPHAIESDCPIGSDDLLAAGPAHPVNVRSATSRIRTLMLDPSGKNRKSQIVDVPRGEGQARFREPWPSSADVRRITITFS